MEDARWPLEWTDRLQRLAAVLSGVADPATMAREAVEQGRAALAADAGVVFLLSSDGGTVEIGHDSGYPEDSIRPWGRIPLSADLPATEAIRNRQTVLVRSRDEMRRRYPELAGKKSTFIHDSWAAVPMVVEGVCIGALGFSFSVAQDFEAPEVAFLQVVADQCAQALQRAQLGERERRTTARLRMLAEASRALAAASLDVGSVLAAIAAQVLAHVGQSCAISLASPDGDWLEMATVQDQDPERERLQRQMAGTLRIRRGEGLSGKVLATERPVLLPSVAPNELAWRAAPALASRVEALRVQSVMCVPLRSRGRTLGTIATSRFSEGQPFTADDLSLLEDLADRAALAIENARLHEAEREARARAEDADRRKDEFLAMLGHELRNPLAPLLMAIEILRQLPADEKSQAWARDAIARQVAQLSRLVDDLLDVSRISLGKIELRLEPLDLGAVAAQALEASRPLLADREHRVVVELPAAPVLVRGDAVRLTQAISNLLNNAASTPTARARCACAWPPWASRRSSPSPTPALASPLTCWGGCSSCSRRDDRRAIDRGGASASASRSSSASSRCTAGTCRSRALARGTAASSCSDSRGSTGPPRPSAIPCRRRSPQRPAGACWSRTTTSTPPRDCATSWSCATRRSRSFTTARRRRGRCRARNSRSSCSTSASPGWTGWRSPVASARASRCAAR